MRAVCGQERHNHEIALPKAFPLSFSTVTNMSRERGADGKFPIQLPNGAGRGANYRDRYFQRANSFLSDRTIKSKTGEEQRALIDQKVF